MKFSKPDPAVWPRLLSYTNILNLAIKKPFITIAMVCFITVFFAWQIPTLSFNTSIEDLVIKTLPENQIYKAFNKTFGPGEIIRVVIKSKNVFHPETFQQIAAFSKTAKKYRV